MEVKFEQITDSERKTKAVMDYYGSSIDIDEINNSEVWAITNEDTEEIFFRLMVMKKNIWNDLQENSIKITHIAGHGSIYEKEILMKFYLLVESYYVNNGVSYITVSIPKVKGITVLRKFFKKTGFSEYKECKGSVSKNGDMEEGEIKTLLLKSNFLEDWYVKKDGRFYPTIETEENGQYKPIKKKIAKKRNPELNV